MTRGKNKKDEIDMRSSHYLSSLQMGFLRLTKSRPYEFRFQSRARDEVSRKRPTLQRLPITRALEWFFFLSVETWALKHVLFQSMLCFIEMAHDKWCLDKSVG